MYLAELIMKIENLRDRLNELVDTKANYKEILEVSQELDKLIVEFYGTAE